MARERNVAIKINSYAMPFSNLSHLDFHEKVRATRLSGFEQFSLMPIEVKEIVAQGIPVEDMVRIAADQGLRISRLDPLNTWPRVWRPDNMDEAYVARVSEGVDEFFSIAERLGCSFASLNATFPPGAMPVGEITEHFAAVCRRAREHGMTCDLEPIPLWGVPTLEMGWEIVREAGQPNGGLVFDIWHFIRSGSHLDTLAAIPGSLVHCVQLSDGPRDLPAGVTVKEDCYNRLFPGEGEFPHAEVIGVLDRIGGLNEVGPEVFSPSLATMGAEQVAAKSRASIDHVFALAGGAPAGGV